MKKNTILLIWITIAMVLVISVVGTYAYFTARISTKNEENNTTTVRTEALASALMDLGTLVESNGALPGYKVIKTIQVMGEGELNARSITATITLTPDVRDFGTHVKYYLYEMETSDAVDANSICTPTNPTRTNNEYFDSMTCDTTNLGKEVTSGTFQGTEVVNQDIVVTSTTNKTYYLLVEYENDENANQNSEQGKSFSVTIGFNNNGLVYKESILNGADPVLKSGLIPVKIGDHGVVTYASLEEKWYEYANKEWANAVILTDTSKEYKVGETIEESDIESYFVWIPKYSYQLWDLTSYLSLSTLDTSKVHKIKIKFGIENTSDQNEDECTTPMTSGNIGNCQIGDYMTSPAFISMNTNGLWVGKFETGYKGAESPSAAQVNSSDSTKVQIKPNVYSWRSIQISNAYKASYNYKREMDSHMMKNTEWGAVAYLQHSKYGSATNVRSNNNSAIITGYASIEEPIAGFNNGTSIVGNQVESTALGVDGTYTINYLNPSSVVASTTGNYSGIYDMSGGAWEETMGVRSSLSSGMGISENIDAKYYDLYESSPNYSSYQYRILGDGTSEFGPFQSIKDPDNSYRNKSGWYRNYGQFVFSTGPWFTRGGSWRDGASSGILGFFSNDGGTSSFISFRVVLAI